MSLMICVDLRICAMYFSWFHALCVWAVNMIIWPFWVLAIAPPGRDYPSQKVDSIACFPAVSHLQLIHLGHDNMTSSTFRPLCDGNRAWLLRLAVSNKKLSEMKFTVNISSSVNLECRHGCAFHGFRLFRELIVLLTYLAHLHQEYFIQQCGWYFWHAAPYSPTTRSLVLFIEVVLYLNIYPDAFSSKHGSGVKWKMTLPSLSV